MLLRVATTLRCTKIESLSTNIELQDVETLDPQPSTQTSICKTQGQGLVCVCVCVCVRVCVCMRVRVWAFRSPIPYDLNKRLFHTRADGPYICTKEPHITYARKSPIFAQKIPRLCMRKRAVHVHKRSLPVEPYVWTSTEASFARMLDFLYVGWLRLVGSIKLEVSFAKKPYKRDVILQKRPVI